MNAAIVDILRATVVAMDAANAGEYHNFQFFRPPKTGFNSKITRDSQSEAVFSSILYSFCFSTIIWKTAANIKLA